MTTKAILRDRVRKILSGGWPSDSDRVKDAEIIQAIGDAMGKLLKLQALETTFSYDGESAIEGSLIATYEELDVTRGNGLTARIQLPASPMYMPEKMGVWSVYPTGQPELEWLPIPAGAYNLWMRENLVNPINRRLYSWANGYITVYDDLIGAGIFKVDVQLCVMDIDRYDDNDILPMSSDMSDALIKEVVAQFAPEPMTDREESWQPSPKKGDK